MEGVTIIALRKQTQFITDLPLVLLLAAYCAFGLAIFYFVTEHNAALLLRQMAKISLGFFVMFIISYISINKIHRLVTYSYLIVAILLGLTLIFGETVGITKRWLSFGIFTLQPSEFMRIILPCVIVLLMCTNRIISATYQVLLALALICIPLALIYLQPDLSTTLLVAMAGLIALFITIRKIDQLLIIALVLATAIFFALFLLESYQLSRFTSFLNPELFTQTGSHQMLQVLSAISQSGWLGNTVGIDLATISARETDFIFSVVAIRYGFIGMMLTIILVLVISWRCLVVASRVDEPYKAAIIAVLALSFLGSSLINMAMNVGLLPVGGSPLPLISLGGTAMLAQFTGFGIILSLLKKE